MLDRISWWFWWALGVDVVLVVAYLAGIVLSQKGSTGTDRKVCVTHLRDPMAALLNFLAIVVALVAAVSGYLATQQPDGSVNLLVLSTGCFILSGLVIVWFLLGLPNLAGDKESITFRFPRDWDVVLLPNLAKVLVILGLAELGGYLLVELRVASPAPDHAASAAMVTVWSADRPCVVETDLHDGKVRVAVDNRRPAGASPSGVTCTARVSLPKEDRP
jgi:hypothetical protein